MSSHSMQKGRRFFLLFPFLLVILIFCLLYASYSVPRPWRASYFANLSLRGKPFAVLNEKGPVHDWNTHAPLEGMPPDNFSVRWEATLVVNKETTITFKIRADDGAQLYIGEELMNKGGLLNVNETFTLKKVFIPGAYDLRLDYFEQGLSANIELLLTGAEVSDFTLHLPSH